MVKTKHLLIASSTLVSLTAISGIILSSSSVSADDVVDQVNITVPESCTMSGTGTDSHNAEINNGTHNSNIGTTTIKAFCNDNEGFAIYAIGYTDNEDGKNVLTSSTLGSTHDIVTGTATNGNTSNWAMKLSTITSPTPTYPIIIAGTNEDTLKEQGDPDYSTFQEVPDDYTKVAYRTSGTDIGANAEGATLKTTYQAYISQTQPAGTYTGQVKYTLIHPYDTTAPQKEEITATGKIGYYSNANDALGAMANQTLTALDKKDWSQCEYDTDYETYCTLYPAPDGQKDINWINENLPDLDHYETFLWASNFHREGYGFAGWNTKPDYSGINYGPNERIILPSNVDTGKGLSLYAIWVPSAGVMQDFTPAQCSAMSVNQVTALTDIRDNNTYAVAKLADNKCWMIENLRLANEYTANNVATPVVLSSTNTHNPALPLANSNGTTSNSLSTPTNPTQTAWCTNYTSASCTDQSMLAVNNTVNSDTMSSSDDDVYSYGNYYNWYSATAGNGTKSVNYGIQVNGSICPKNWYLPSLEVEGGSGDYNDLSNALNIGTANTVTGFIRYPANFVYSGGAYEGTVGERGKGGSYYSSVSAGGGGANSFTISRTSSYTSGGIWISVGGSVRCLFKTN